MEEEKIDPHVMAEATQRWLVQIDEQINDARNRLTNMSPNRDSFAVHYAHEQAHYMTLLAVREGHATILMQLANPQ